MWARLDPATDILHSRTVVCCRLYGRLRPDATEQQAQAEVSGLFRRLRQMFPQDDSGEGTKQDRAAVVPASAFGAPDKELFTIAAFVLAAVSMVLLIACSNVAGLLLARSANRQKEIAIRLAIGASRGRLVRQLLTESALISVLAGATGLVFAWWMLHFLMVQISASMPVRWMTIALHLAPDHRVFAYMLLLSMAAATAFGLVPA
ncbi:MAG: hypothetical protein DMG57_42295 [Acidobacteria bacterium]|nr:MAG: hypothetical protein DMG57_42295 [Acidobacteriota bacterium]